MYYRTGQGHLVWWSQYQFYTDKLALGESNLIRLVSLLLQNGRIQEVQDISLIGFEGRAASLCDGNGWVSNIIIFRIFA